MKCCLYLRVSSTEQHTDNQLPALESYARTRGWEVAEVYSENESAWKGGHQRELARLLGDLETGRRKYDYLLVWSLDRLTREGIGTLLSLYNRFNHYDCRIVSVKESWTEMPNEMTPIFLAMIGFFAKWESDRRSERTLAGLARARAEGKPIGKRGPDKAPRKRTGYLLRYANKGAPKNKAEVVAENV